MIYIYIFYFLFFGFLLTAIIGLLASWIDRKVTAKVQYRVGPPLLQPLIDIVKLLGKETLIPAGSSKITFLMAPVIGFASVILVSTLLWVNNIYPTKSFLGDLIVVLYLLVIPSISIIMGGFASKNPLASLGASREMKLILSYELPFILAVLVAVIKSGFTFRLGEILAFQAQNGAFVTSWSGTLALIVAIICMQAKLALVPFDIPEAETEIVGGPLIDIVKLLGKETLIPAGASKITFLMAPVIGLASVILVSTLLWINNIYPARSFLGDLIVVLYLLVIPSISIIMGGFASRNPLASLGASREMKLILSYELPFILAILVAVIKSGFTFRLGEILIFQGQNGAFVKSWSGTLALIVAIICMQAKLALVPFDIPEAETEISGGVLIEYSGTGLAIYRLMKNMLMFTVPFFLIIVFMGGLRFDGIHLLYGGLKYIGLVALMTVIRNTNPRVRIDQAVKFFWGPMTIIAIIAIILALLGR